MGLKKTHVSTILKHVDVFEGMLKQQGYAVEYTFNQACYMVIGCLLLELGLSTRHVNIALVTLGSNFNYAGEDWALGFGNEKARQRIINDKLFLVVRRCSYIAHNCGNPIEEFIYPVVSIVTGLTNPATVAFKHARLADIGSYFEPENYDDRVYKTDDGQELRPKKDPACIRIDLCWLIEEVTKLFS